jgi:hypothetical protein
LVALALLAVRPAFTEEETRRVLFESHCFNCHDADKKRGDLDVTALKPDIASPENFARWGTVCDRIESGEMLPKKKELTPADQKAEALKSLRDSLLAAEQQKLASDLPADGSAHGFDDNADALEISHVNFAKSVEAAGKTLDLAVATQPHGQRWRRARS